MPDVESKEHKEHSYFRPSMHSPAEHPPRSTGVRTSRRGSSATCRADDSKSVKTEDSHQRFTKNTCSIS